MKKIVVTNYKDFGDIPEKKTLVIEGEEIMEAQDGYHTFRELYEHRIALFIALCKHVGERGVLQVWRSKKHSDGELAFGGTWFVLGINKEKGKQITYHLPIEKWKDTECFEDLDKAPEWDGHTPDDVIKRINNL